MSATGIVLYGGILDGREINTARELEQANANPHVGGRYEQTQRRARDGRLIFTFARHTESDDA